MAEDHSLQIASLEKEVHRLRMAAARWEDIRKIYEDSIEKLKEAEKRLSQSHEQKEKALAGGNLAWWEWNFLTGDLFINENKARLLGFEAVPFFGKHNELLGMIHPDDRPVVDERLKQHIEGTKPYYEAEFRLQDHLGGWRWFFDRGKIVETDIRGNPIRLSGVLIEIHDRKNSENELVAARDKADTDSRAKSHFLAGMSHEIYTPLAGVIGMADILRQSKLSQEQEEYIDVLVKSATNLMSILNDIMEFSRLESGPPELHEKPFSIHQVIEEVAGSFAEKAAVKKIEMLSFQDPEIPKEVIGDPVRVRQILRILTDNALKFTDEGEIMVRADFVEWDEETVKVKFSVSDTGIGISEEGMKKLFRSFSKVDTGEAGKYGGGGLGLAIAKRLIDRMNGTIRVESAPGEGTSFHILIVFDRYRESEGPDRTRDLVAGLKVLLVDPVASHRSILRSYFFRWECDVEECDNADEALRMLKQHAGIKKPFDLVFIEFDGHGMNGQKLAAAIGHDAATAHTSVLFSTNRSTDISPAEMSAAGVIGSIIRPYTLGRIRNRIKEALSRNPREIIRGGDEHDFGNRELQRKQLFILLAEDNLINQRVAKVTLEKMGHLVDIAENGEIAVSMFAAKQYDLVLMDLYMPVLNGLDATLRIRAHEKSQPGKVPVHICAITANRLPEDEQNCYNAGMNSYISKPFRLEELMRILAHL